MELRQGAKLQLGASTRTFVLEASAPTMPSSILPFIHSLPCPIIFTEAAISDNSDPTSREDFLPSHSEIGLFPLDGSSLRLVSWSSS